MRIAFCHNLATDGSEAVAEFDSPQTVAAITNALAAGGHEVFPIDVALPLPQLCERLLAVQPDLVFNTAEGFAGREREAVYPMLYSQLGLPHTGSDAHACLVTLDKYLTRLIVQAVGVPVAPGGFTNRPDPTQFASLRYPLFVKPNFEGSSKGIDEHGRIARPQDLEAALKCGLERFPDGLLVEEFVAGRDVVVPWLEAVGPLPPAMYAFGDDSAIYDYRLKHEASDNVRVVCPAPLPDGVVRRLNELTRATVSSLGVRDAARLDFRVTPDNGVVFLEINALPSLEEGASIYEAAALVGLNGMAEVLEQIVATATARFRSGTRPASARRVGLAYNLKRTVPQLSGDDDQDAEFDSADTVVAIARAIESQGHEVVLLEARRDFLERVQRERIDVVFNIAEGYAGRSREAQVPAALELLGIPYTGSDPTALSITLDKALAKRVVAAAGVPTPRFFVLSRGDEPTPPLWSFPCVVKPVAEGSSKGLHASSVVHDEAGLRSMAGQLLRRYRQPVLVEAFLPGRELTVAVLEWPDRVALAPMEIVFDTADPHPVYSFAHKQAQTDEIRYQAPARLEQALDAAVRDVALRAFDALGCRDVARIDIRLDENGIPCFIECNPLPGLTPEWSDLCMIATSEGIAYHDLVARILAPAVGRSLQKEAL
ncbi:MAG: D-alanine-D-alanine ligase [Myxococcota bacterium]|jgi:D-alanine-D-alanine ligase